MNWFFIRHGEIESNRQQIYSGRSDEGLTVTGRSQVEDACRELAGRSIESIFCSPLVRTRQSAEIIVDKLGRNLPLHIDNHFNELKMGPWEGKSERDIALHYPQQWALWNATPAELELPGRETLLELQQRAVAGLNRIRQSHRLNTVLIVTHVAVIRILSLYAGDIDLNRYKSISVGNAEIFQLNFPGFD